MKKMNFLFISIVALSIGLWMAGRPTMRSLAGNSNLSLVRWQLGKQQLKEFGPLADISFAIPEGCKVQIDRQEDFVTYQVSNPAGARLLAMYFGAHPEWPPRTNWLDWRSAAVHKGDMTIEVITYWSLLNFSKDVWISRSPEGWGVHARYTHLSKIDAALADKIIDSIQPPIRPGN